MTDAATMGQDATRCGDAAQGQGAGRRTLLCAGLAGAGMALAGCSTAAVPYDANDGGQAPSAAAAAAQPTAQATMAEAAGAGAGAGSGSAMPTGTVLGEATAIPVGGGMVFTASKVVVTQPTKGVFKAFSAVCTLSLIHISE